MKKDWRRVPDWGCEEPPQHRGGGEAGWGQLPPPPGIARPSNSKPGKPPPAPGSWQQTVPSWERRFCTAICRVPWRKICETKRLMPYYSSVVDWNDSAGKEAFDNAKARFFAEINGLPCDISLPGPDIYIDEINWDSEIDPQLLLDLDKEFQPEDIDAKDVKIGFLSSGWDRAIPCTGWEDAEDITSPVRDAQAELGWVNSGENGANLNEWDNNKDWGGGAVDTSGWGAGAQDTSAWGAGAWDYNSGWGGGACQDNGGWGAGNWEDNSGWGTGCGEDNFRWGAGSGERFLDNKRVNNSWGQQDNNRNNQMSYWGSKRYARKREGDRLYNSRLPSFRHQRDEFHQPFNNHWRNDRGRKRANYQNEQPALNESLMPQQWNAIRGPRNKYGSAAAGGF